MMREKSEKRRSLRRQGGAVRKAGSGEMRLPQVDSCTL